MMSSPEEQPTSPEPKPETIHTYHDLENAQQALDRGETVKIEVTTLDLRRLERAMNTLYQKRQQTQK